MYPQRVFPSDLREDFDPALLHPGVEPPHYELCALRRAPSVDLADAAMAEDFEKFHKLRRSSSKCIRDHHCGSQHGSVHGSVHGSIHGSRSNLSMRDATIPADGGALAPPVVLGQQSPRPSHHSGAAGRRSVVVMKHSYSQDGADRYRAQEDEDLMEDEGNTFSTHPHLHHEHTVHRTLSNDF